MEPDRTIKRDYREDKEMKKNMVRLKKQSLLKKVKQSQLKK